MHPRQETPTGKQVAVSDMAVRAYVNSKNVSHNELGLPDGD